MQTTPRTVKPPARSVTRWWPLLAVFIVALGLRLGYMAQTMQGPLFDTFLTDARWHAEWATQIAEGRWHPDRPLFRAPLYPLFLAGIRLATGDGFLWARIVQHVLGALSCVMVALLGARVFSERVGWIAGAVCALYVPLIYFENELLIPSLAIAFFLATLLVVERAERRPAWFRWGVAGLLLGLCAVARPTFLLLGPVVVLWWLMQRRAERPWRRRMRDAVIFTAGVVLPIVPVTVHNRVTGGEWALISTQGGTNFFIGNNPAADGKTAVAFAPPRWEEHNEYVDNVWWASRVNAEALSGRQLSDSQVSRFWFNRGLAFWRDQPAPALGLLLRKAYYLLNGFEIESNRSMYLDRLWSSIATVLLSSEQALIAYPFGLLGPLALIGLCWRGRGRPLAGLMRWMILCYAVLIIAFFVNGRFRVPLTPLLALFAADAVLRLISAARARKYATVRIVSFVFVGLVVFCNSSLLGVRNIDYSRQAGIIGGAYREVGQLRKARVYLEEAAAKAAPDDFARLSRSRLGPTRTGRLRGSRGFLPPRSRPGTANDLRPPGAGGGSDVAGADC